MGTASRPAQTADRSGGVEAVHDRHAQVHQHQVRTGVPGEVERLLAIAGQRHVEAERLEHLPQQLAVLLLIVGDQDAAARTFVALDRARVPPARPAPPR